MKRRLLLLLCSTAFLISSKAAETPNILWITAEDMSPVLGCYGDAAAITPHIDKLAAQSVKYANAFATAPVCSPSRSCLINGLMATSQGTQQMRSAFPIPAAMTGFPAILRKLGYYTSNNVKTDYNSAQWQSIVKASWDANSAAADWQPKTTDQPFFSIFNLMTSHQSRAMVWPYEKFQTEIQSRLPKEHIHDPATIPLPSYYPDTPLIRKTLARFYDCVTVMDQEVGAILKRLEEDGLAEDTIVFFYSDHGSGLPRHKRALLDSGMHVPLLIRFPERYKHLAPAAAGETIDRLVNFADFAPTVLNLTRQPIPPTMQGQPFLGPNQQDPHSALYGHRDRVDEVIDLSRSVRDKQFLYIRNYMPHLGYNQRTAWPDLGDIRHEIYRLTDKSEMSEPQWHFAGPTRPVEELYDCTKDPENLQNLAGQTAHRKTLRKMRSQHESHLRASKDLGFIPEIQAWIDSKDSTPMAYYADKPDLLDTVYRAAADVGRGKQEACITHLSHPHPAVRYWGVIGLAANPELFDDAHRALVAALADPAAAVRVEAANALARHGDLETSLPILDASLQSADLTEVMVAARHVELLGKKAAVLKPTMQAVVMRCEEIRPPDLSPVTVTSGAQDLAMFFGFSARAFLTQLDARPWRDLFDGTTLNGWTAQAAGDVSVVDGEIRMLSKTANLWLVHEEVFTNVEVEVEALMPDLYNSGIGFRCAGKKIKGYQCEIDAAKSGQIYAIGAGWVWPKGKEETKRFADMAGDTFKAGQWNHFRIRNVGSSIQIWVNGVLTADVEDERYTSGSIALQHHGKGDVHRFRNVRIKTLP